MSVSEDYNVSLHIGAVFILLVASALGVLLPSMSATVQRGFLSLLGRKESSNCSSHVIFALKYFGGGIILATAFIHLLSEARMYIDSPCLDGLQFGATSEAVSMAAVWLMFVLDCKLKVCRKTIW